jgi:hypothetical protein
MAVGPRVYQQRSAFAPNSIRKQHSVAWEGAAVTHALVVAGLPGDGYSTIILSWLQNATAHSLQHTMNAISVAVKPKFVIINIVKSTLLEP